VSICDFLNFLKFKIFLLKKPHPKYEKPRFGP